MRADALTMNTPSFPSFAAVLASLETLKSILQFTVPGTQDTALARSAGALLASMGEAEKALVIYLFQMAHRPGGRKLEPSDVVAAFHAMTAAWENIPSPARFEFITTHGIDAYEHSVAALLEDPQALQAARDAMPLAFATLVEDAFK